MDLFSLYIFYASIGISLPDYGVVALIAYRLQHTP